MLVIPFDWKTLSDWQPFFDVKNFVMFDEIVFQPENIDDNDFMPIISVSDEDEPSLNEDFPSVLPVLALKNTVLFPGIVIPITIGREKSIKAVKKAHSADKLIAVLSQKDDTIEDALFSELYGVGTVAKILKLLKMPDGSITAILQGRGRYEVLQPTSEDPYLEAELSKMPFQNIEDNLEFEALVSTIRELSEKIIRMSPNIPNEAMVMIKNIKQDSFLISFIASNLGIDVTKKQELLEHNDLMKMAQRVHEHMHNEMQILELKNQLENKVRGDIEKQQRDYFLNQQMKMIQEELGQNPQTEQLTEFEARAKKISWSDEAKAHFEKEMNKAKRMNPQAAEYSVTLNYLELMLDLPWDKITKDNFDLKEVRKVLDRDHFGLKDVKERIIEHLAVLKLKGDMKAPILCLVGPPGVGKTSLGKSIANALKRKFVRMSLGGLHDESEIRGHRKTYIGAMPGRIIQGLKKAKSSNPVFILDEIDKVGKDFRGDPSSALLEVLDPEQNGSFHDNYLELEYDLSKILFIATANSLSTIQPALLDRMEIIELTGYSTEEKVMIAKNHLIPKQRKDHGLKATHVKFPMETSQAIVEQYTREAGVRSLDRQIGGVMRSVAKKVALEESYSPTIKAEHLKEMLGPIKFTKELYTETQKPGVAVGLAWTRVGGEILFIESSLSDGKGKLTLTGNLGDVMKESASTALSFIKANCDKLDIDPEVFNTTDIHIHVPEGATPKDGPSAGVTMITAITSALKKKPVKPFLAMTGEITLRGKVLPVGGIKSKLLAAKRAGMTEIMLSKQNEKHVEEINEEYLKGLNFVFVDRMEEVLNHALGVWSF